MKRNVAKFAAAGWIGLAAAYSAPAQETSPSAPEPEAERATPVVSRPLEGNVIINLPSVEVPTEGLLTILFTHRFQQPVQDSTIHDLYSFDNGARIGIGIWYAPLKNLNVGFYRSSELDVYEVSAQYQLPIRGAFAASLRVGEDWRTDTNTVSPHSSFFAQAVLAYSIGQYARLTVVPTYLQRANGSPSIFGSGTRPPPPHDGSCTALPIVPPPPNPVFTCSGLYEDVFNVPVALSISLTRTIRIHAEVTPRLAEVDSNGVGWTVALEKVLLRHRFAFTAGNQRQTTVDQYLPSVPYTQSSGNVYLGFNITRQWKLK
jgi:Membrane bound beta barrel domain (DUF5777)